MKLPKFLDKKSLLLNAYKRMRPMTVLFSIVLGLCMPVLCLLMLSTGSTSVDYLDISKVLAHIMGREYVLISAAFGVFAGCSVMRSYTKRQSAVLFASLPVRREKLFLINYASGWLSYLTATVISVVLTCGVFLMYGGLSQIGGLFSCMGAGIIWFFFAYSLTAFAGSLCGLTSIQFLFTGTILAYLPAVTALTAFLVDDVFYEFINVNYYLSAETMEYLSPVVRLFVNVIESFADTLNGHDGVHHLYSGWLWYTLAAVALTAFATLILRLRKPERAGTPIVFSGLNSVVKYAIMIPCTLLMGIVFYVTESLLFMVVGFAVGAVLSFMLLNVILEKNPRAYFKGIRGLGIYVLCFGAIFAMLAIDPFGVNEYIPSPESAKSATIYLDGVPVEFTDKDDIERVNAIMKAAQEDEVEQRYYYLSDGYYGLHSMNVIVVYELGGGIPFAKYAFLASTSTVNEEYSELLMSDEYREAVKAQAEEQLNNGYIEDISLEYIANYNGEYGYSTAHLSKEEAKRMLELIEDNYRFFVSRELGPQVATLHLGYTAYGIPIYYEYMEEIHSQIPHREREYYPTADINKYLARMDKVRLGTGEEFTDRGIIRDMFLKSEGFNPSHTLMESYSPENEVTFICGYQEWITYLYD